MACLTPDAAGGGPFDIHVTARETSLRITDVLFGDVFVCIGQSNMEYSVALAGDDAMLDDAVNHPDIRLLTVGSTANAWTDTVRCLCLCKRLGADLAKEAADVPHLLQPWTLPSREALGSISTDDFPEIFSSVAWNFALALQSRAEPAVPVGLVVAAANGATILVQTRVDCSLLAAVGTDPTRQCHLLMPLQYAKHSSLQLLSRMTAAPGRQVPFGTAC